MDAEYRRLIKAAESSKPRGDIAGLRDEHRNEKHMLYEDPEVLHTKRLIRTARRRTLSVAQRQVRSSDSGIPVVDDRMRIPSFMETCPHICDNIIPLNGGRFNVDHYLRVLRAKAETDVSIAMALTVRPL